MELERKLTYCAKCGQAIAGGLLSLEDELEQIAELLQSFAFAR